MILNEKFGEVDPRTAQLAARLGVCSNDGIYCDKCKVRVPCIKWWDRFVDESPTLLRMGLGADKIREFRKAKRA